jgi:uncharacterized protein
MRPVSTPGWYPDPTVPGQQRWWDGQRWSEHIAPGGTPAPYDARQPMTPEQARQWAMLGHLSALGGLIIGGFMFLGPLIVYLVKKDEDPFVADQSREALNFNLSALLYEVMLGIVTFILIFLIVGLLLIPVLIALVVAHVVLVIVGGVQANKGVAYRYPLTIRFIQT